MVKNKRLIVLVIATVVCLTFAIASVAIMRNRGLEAAPKYPINEYGLTYGSGDQAISVETEPDLIAAIGVDGNEGYVYSKDLNGEMAKTPEEAAAQTRALQEAAQNAVGKDGTSTITVREIPLYEVEGKTIIGSFAITYTFGGK